MYVCFPQELYEEDQNVLKDIQALLAHDWKELQQHGLHVDGHRVYPILLGIKGDWSYHVPRRSVAMRVVLFAFCCNCCRQHDCFLRATIICAGFLTRIPG